MIFSQATTLLLSIAAVGAAVPFQNERSLVVGGEDASPGRYPYFAFLNYEAFGFTGNCGASLM